MIQYPGFDKIAFEIGPIVSFGPLKVHWYGIMYLIAFVAGWWLARLRARKPGSTWKPGDVDDFMFFCMLGTILGGRLGYVLFYGLSFWAKDPWYPIKVWDGGMSFHGGLLGVLIGLAIFAVRRRRKVADVFDFAAPLPGIGLCAGRIGNFINGELWGRHADPSLPWAMIFPQAPDRLPRHPSQLYQFALEGLLLFVLLWWYASKPRQRGQVSGAFLLGYGVFRFIAEYFREPDAHLGLLALNMSMGQWLCIPMIVGGAVLWRWAARRNITE
jgi:phosphatidylglycerol:prolipoprotein diacylglycerol transferase